MRSKQEVDRGEALEYDARDDFDSDREQQGATPSPTGQLPRGGRAPSLLQMIQRHHLVAGRTHSLEGAVVAQPTKRRETSSVQGAGASDQDEPVTIEGLHQQLGQLKTHFTQQLEEQRKHFEDEMTMQSLVHGQELEAVEGRLSGEIAGLTRQLDHERAQRNQQQQAADTELEGATTDGFQGVLGTVERLDRQQRQNNIVLSGLNIPPGGRGALTHHVQQLLSGHANVPQEAVSAVRCIGPIRRAGSRLVVVQFRTIQEKHAAFKACSNLRQMQIFMDDDLTKAQLANRRALQPARQGYVQAGKRTWWRQDSLLYSEAGVTHKHGEPRPATARTPPPPPEPRPAPQSANAGNRSHPRRRQPGSAPAGAGPTQQAQPGEGIRSGGGGRHRGQGQQQAAPPSQRRHGQPGLAAGRVSQA